MSELRLQQRIGEGKYQTGTWRDDGRCVLEGIWKVAGRTKRGGSLVACKDVIGYIFMHKRKEGIFMHKRKEGKSPIACDVRKTAPHLLQHMHKESFPCARFGQSELRHVPH